jgi:ectoine hydroxylase-related dioxygenase (phytanoyl-CoA dioxygenase family)
MSPVPRSTLDEAVADVRETGVGVVTGVLDADETASIRAALWAAAEAEERRGEELRVAALDPNPHNLRVVRLINEGAAFVGLALHEVALAAATALLGERFLLSNISANIALPGSGSMELHADQGYVVPPWPPTPLAVNVMWLLDDFTEATGATRYVPGTVRADRGPEPTEQVETVPIVAPAGSVALMDARVWHTSGCNRTADQERAGIFAYYVLPWLRPQVNWTAALDPDVVATAPPGLLELVGYHDGNAELRRRLVAARDQRLGAG